MSSHPINWQLNDNNYIETRQYECAYCESKVASYLGIRGFATSSQGQMVPKETVCICPECSRPTYISISGEQIPAPLPGRAVEHLPALIDVLFTEARQAASVGAHTAAVMLCRTLLMHIAVDKQAPTKNDRGKILSFKEYVDYLDAKHLIPNGAIDWVSTIREMGNEATHELTIMGIDEAELILEFTTLLLQTLYEAHGKMQRRLGRG